MTTKMVQRDAEPAAPTECASHNISSSGSAGWKHIIVGITGGTAPELPREQVGCRLRGTFAARNKGGPAGTNLVRVSYTGIVSRQL